VPEYLTKRFGPICGAIFSFVLLFVYVFVYLVSVLYGGSLAFAELTGLNFYLVLALTAGLVGLYSIKGGLTSVMWTTMIQCVLLVGGGALLFFYALSKIDGGWSAMMAANPDRMHLYQPANHQMAPFLGMIVATFGAFTFYQAGNQAMVQRILGARSTWDGLMGLVCGAFINLLRPLVTCFLGLVVYHWIMEMHKAPPLENFDTAFPFALTNLAPSWGLRGIVLAGFLAAVMSTISSLTNSTSTIFATDVYQRYIKKDATDHQMVRVGQIAAFAAILIGACLAPIVAKLGGIFLFFQTAITYIACPFMATILMGLIWKRVNYPAAVFGLVGGLIIQITLAILFSGTVGSIPKLHFFYVGAIAEVIIMIAIAIVTLMTTKPDYEKIKPFVWNLKLLTQYDQGITRPWYKQVKLWWTLYAAIWLTIYYKFW